MRIRTLATALAAIGLAAATAACGSGGSSSTTTPPTTETAATSSVKACLVSDVGRFNDKGFNQLQLQGLKEAASKLGIKTKAVESHAAGDYIPNLSSCARAGYDITISAGFLLANQTATVAKQYPNQSFAITDYSVTGAPFNGPKSPNVAGITYATQENSYLVGCLAGLMVKKQGGKQTIGVVGGVKIPPVDSFLAGYQAGAKKCNPGVTVLIGYSQDFIDQAKCKTVAQNQISAGSQIEFNVAGPCGLGTLDAAKQAGVWGIGVDTDQAFLGPHILTSAVKRVDTGIYLTVKSVIDGTFQGGQDLVFNLKNDGVGLGKTSPKVPKDFLSKLDDLKQQIIDGTIVPPATVKSG
jgi:basic membrane protein A and related proteins